MGTGRSTSDGTLTDCREMIDLTRSPFIVIASKYCLSSGLPQRTSCYPRLSISGRWTQSCAHPFLSGQSEQLLAFRSTRPKAEVIAARRASTSTTARSPVTGHLSSFLPRKRKKVSATRGNRMYSTASAIIEQTMIHGALICSHPLSLHVQRSGPIMCEGPAITADHYTTPPRTFPPATRGLIPGKTSPPPAFSPLASCCLPSLRQVFVDVTQPGFQCSQEHGTLLF